MLHNFGVHQMVHIKRELVHEEQRAANQMDVRMGVGVPQKLVVHVFARPLVQNGFDHARLVRNPVLGQAPDERRSRQGIR